MSPLVLDVSHLPKTVEDHRAPIWWGNVLMLAIESTMFLLLIASYFYVWQNFTQWPPPQTVRDPINYSPLPDLGLSTVNTLVLLIAIAPMLWASRACLSMNVRAVQIGMVLTVVVGLAIMGLEYEVLTTSTHFKWSDNAYASVVWTTLGLHLLHVTISTGENALMTAWVLIEGLDKEHARDIRVTAVYWYWVVGVWCLLYAILYWGPRVM